MIRKILVLCCAISFFQTSAQSVDSAQVFSGIPVKVFSEVPISIWGNFSNKGVINSQEGAQLVFFGDIWTNSPTSSLPGGGIFQFTKPRPTPYLSSSNQFLSGGGSSASFPDLMVNNTSNLQLFGTSTFVRDTVLLQNGKVVLNDQNFGLGTNVAGALLGYSESKYFVTNGSPTDTLSGFLLRSAVGNVPMDYPVGPSTLKYTPASITNAGVADTYQVRAFDGVYGRAFYDSLQNYKSVGTTWQVLESTPGGSDVLLQLQHNQSDEGVQYTRNSQYIARYIGTNHNTLGGTSSRDSYWDLVPSTSATSNSASGFITTGTPVSSAYVSSRRFNTAQDFSEFSFFTKSPVNAPPLPVTLVNFTAKWEGLNARLAWETSSEKNGDRFVLSRSLDGVHFQEITAVPCTNTNSTHFYAWVDSEIKNWAQSVIYYKLSQVDLDGTEYNWGVKALVPSSEKDIHFGEPFPSPATDLVTFPIIATHSGQNLRINIWDSNGKQVITLLKPVSSGEQWFTCNVADLAPGVYTVQFQTNQGTVVSKRMVVVH